MRLTAAVGLFISATVLCNAENNVNDANGLTWEGVLSQGLVAGLDSIGSGVEQDVVEGRRTASLADIGEKRSLHVKHSFEHADPFHGSVHFAVNGTRHAHTVLSMSAAGAESGSGEGQGEGERSLLSTLTTVHCSSASAQDSLSMSFAVALPSDHVDTALDLPAIGSFLALDSRPLPSLRSEDASAKDKTGTAPESLRGHKADKAQQSKATTHANKLSEAVQRIRKASIDRCLALAHSLVPSSSSSSSAAGAGAGRHHSSSSSSTHAAPVQYFRITAVHAPEAVDTGLASQPGTQDKQQRDGREHEATSQKRKTQVKVHITAVPVAPWELFEGLTVTYKRSGPISSVLGGIPGYSGPKAYNSRAGEVEQTQAQAQEVADEEEGEEERGSADELGEEGREGAEVTRRRRLDTGRASYSGLSFEVDGAIPIFDTVGNAATLNCRKCSLGFDTMDYSLTFSWIGNFLQVWTTSITVSMSTSFQAELIAPSPSPAPASSSSSSSSSAGAGGSMNAGAGPFQSGDGFTLPLAQNASKWDRDLAPSFIITDSAGYQVEFWLLAAWGMWGAISVDAPVQGTVRLGFSWAGTAAEVVKYDTNKKQWSRTDTRISTDPSKGITPRGPEFANFRVVNNSTNTSLPVPYLPTDSPLPPVNISFTIAPYIEAWVSGQTSQYYMPMFKAVVTAGNGVNAACGTAADGSAMAGYTQKVYGSIGNGGNSAVWFDKTVDKYFYGGTYFEEAYEAPTGAFNSLDFRVGACGGQPCTGCTANAPLKSDATADDSSTTVIIAASAGGGGFLLIAAAGAFIALRVGCGGRRRKGGKVGSPVPTGGSQSSSSSSSKGGIAKMASWAPGRKAAVSTSSTSASAMDNSDAHDNGEFSLKDMPDTIDTVAILDAREKEVKDKRKGSMKNVTLNPAAEAAKKAAMVAKVAVTSDETGIMLNPLSIASAPGAVEAPISSPGGQRVVNPLSSIAGGSYNSSSGLSIDARKGSTDSTSSAAMTASSRRLLGGASPLAGGGMGIAVRPPSMPRRPVSMASSAAGSSASLLGEDDEHAFAEMEGLIFRKVSVASSASADGGQETPSAPLLPPSSSSWRNSSGPLPPTGRKSTSFSSSSSSAAAAKANAGMAEGDEGGLQGSNPIGQGMPPPPPPPMANTPGSCISVSAGLRLSMSASQTGAGTGLGLDSSLSAERSGIRKGSAAMQDEGGEGESSSGSRSVSVKPVVRRVVALPEGDGEEEDLTAPRTMRHSGAAADKAAEEEEDATAVADEGEQHVQDNSWSKGGIAGSRTSERRAYAPMARNPVRKIRKNL